MLTFTITALLCAVVPAKAVDRAGSRPDRSGSALNIRIDRLRGETRACQSALGLPRSPVSSRPVAGRAYARWVKRLWQIRHNTYCGFLRTLSRPVPAITAVFGERAGEALAVVGCESGYRTTARNGQYHGLFQMGERERATYGHGETPLEQAKAAYRYFVASGRDWSPWECKPNGTVGF